MRLAALIPLVLAACSPGTPQHSGAIVIEPTTAGTDAPWAAWMRFCADYPDQCSKAEGGTGP